MLQGKKADKQRGIDLPLPETEKKRVFFNKLYKEREVAIKKTQPGRKKNSVRLTFKFPLLFH